MPQKVFVIKGQFGFEVVPAEITVVDKANDAIVIFENHCNRDVTLVNLPPGVVAINQPANPTFLNYHAGNNPKPTVQFDFSAVAPGVYDYEASMSNLGVKAKGHSDPRIIVY